MGEQDPQEDDQEFEVEHLIDQNSDVADLLRNMPQEMLDVPKVGDLRRAAS